MSLSQLPYIPLVALNNASIQQVILPNLTSAQSLATDANGILIQGTPTPSIQKWGLPASLFSDLTFGDTALGGSSYAIIDYGSRVVNIFLNLIVIPSSPVSSKVPQFSININETFFTNPSGQTGTLPPPSALFQTYSANLGTSTFFFNDISLCNTTPTPNVFINSQYYFSSYFVNTGIMNISSIGGVSVSSGQRLVYSGTMQYMF
jgi:hypothetical protein